MATATTTAATTATDASEADDFDNDGACDAGDPDDDGDTVPDGDDSDPRDTTVCADADQDSCDDCTNGTFDPCDHGADADGDGICDAGASSPGSCAETGGAQADSCLDYLTAHPGAPDGVYCVDPDGAGPIGSRDVYCDMTRDGGGWTLVYHGRTGDALGFHDVTSDVRVPVDPDPAHANSFKYSDAHISEWSAGGKYRFARDDMGLAARFANALNGYNNLLRQPVAHCSDIEMSQDCYGACVHHFNYYGLIMSGPGCTNSGTSGWSSGYIAINTYANSPWYSHRPDGSYAYFNWWVRAAP